jgi:hypothetical protein
VGAGLTALDMTAQRRRSAALDRRHDLQLAEAHMAGVPKNLCSFAMILLPREMTLRVEPAVTGLRPRPVPAPARCSQLPNPPLPRGTGVDRCLPRRRREPGSDSRLVHLSNGTELMAATLPWPSSAVDRWNVIIHPDRHRR